MKFKYNLSKKNYERIVRRTNSKNNLYYVIAGSLVFLFFIRNLVLDNFMITLILYLVACLIIYGAVELVTILTSKLLVRLNEKGLGVKYGTYECALTKEKFTEKLENTEISIELKDIVRTNKLKNTYEVMTKKMIIVFNKGLFENQDDYDKVVQFFENNIKKQNKKSKNA